MRHVVETYYIDSVLKKAIPMCVCLFCMCVSVYVACTLRF